MSIVHPWLVSLYKERSPLSAEWPGETAPGDAATAAAPTPQPPDGGLLGGLGDWLANNRSALMGLGAGIAGGRTWGEGLSKGFQNSMTGRTLDQQHAAHSQTVAALMRHGLDESTARARRPAIPPCCARSCGSSTIRARVRSSGGLTERATAADLSNGSKSPASIRNRKRRSGA